MSRPYGDKYSIVPSTKAGDSFGIPESFSNAGDGFEQQTFLGASIRSASLSAGFGDSVTTLNVELVNDEYNTSDGLGYGLGDDVYHNGKHDQFAPPPVGSPVFFKIGSKKANINDAFYKTFNDLYGGGNFSGTDHLAFGGILQSYIQNRGSGGNPLYSAQVVDPREILSNCVLLLNNYTGTTFANKNMFNLYGFLEYNPTLILKQQLSSSYPNQDFLTKILNDDGSYSLSGTDLMGSALAGISDQFYNNAYFPITGTGLSRRTSQGIPYYRIQQALNALLGYYGPLPAEYDNAGFGGYINFRGHNYILDLSGLKTIKPYYYFDFDQINLLDFCLEIGDITSSEIFVSLLPIINHPACSYTYNYNNQQMASNNPANIVAGIIRVDSVDKSISPQYGTLKTYIDSLSSNGYDVVNQDIGFELSNVTTDKFIVGAQEVDMYYFSGNADRDSLEHRKEIAGEENLSSYLQAEQWRLKTSYEQQILPYYGLLANKAVTIPRGFGSYQQIALDASNINANGVGNYYIATEIELRAAAVSYERWCEFLLMYNDLYMESIEQEDALEGAVLSGSPAPEGAPPLDPISNNFAVTVPRCVFDLNTTGYNSDQTLIEGCNPPYGYPLYYKRGTRIGLPQAGLASLNSRFTTILTSAALLKGTGDEKFETVLNSEWSKFEDQQEGDLTEAEKQYRDLLKSIIDNADNLDKEDAVGLIQDLANGLNDIMKVFPRLSKKTQENSMRVYNFLKKIADECLGKKFLVKIPREVNLFYSPTITIGANPFVNEYITGPFGFQPRQVDRTPGFSFSDSFQNTMFAERIRTNPYNTLRSFLTVEDGSPLLFNGALQSNYDPISEKYEFNYQPSNQGGYVDFDLSFNSLGVNQGLVPKDLGIFLNDGNRCGAYVRFDNSQDLNFENIGADNVSQQTLQAGYFVPDVSYTLDNIKASNSNFLDAKEFSEDSKVKATAFVKCDVDEQFYMPPLSSEVATSVHATTVKDIGRYSLPRKVLNSETCQYDDSFSYYKPHFVPDLQGFSGFTLVDVTPPDGSFPLGFDYDIISGKKFLKKTPYASYPQVSILEHYLQSDGSIYTDVLDAQHVYALITLPGKVVTSVDSRFRDGQMQKKDPAFFKHTMGMDVVKLPEFAQPGIFDTPNNLFKNPAFAGALDPDSISSAISAYTKTMQTFFPLPHVLNIVAPSPVYPDLVALPLLSRERCYGPWVSSHLDVQAQIYDNLAGKIDFIKDENLSPWNYNGFDLMNEAGFMQAEFSNSLLLSSERGGFSVASAPLGISLASYLLGQGPLVTNIGISISSSSMQTTYKMDLYTAQFGKLQKQKGDMIKNISRERQKAKDEKNALIRKGIGKNQTNVNYSLIYQQIKNQSISVTSSLREYNSYERGEDEPANAIIMQTVPTEEDKHLVPNGSQMSEGNNYSTIKRNTLGAFGSSSQIVNATQNAPDAERLNDSYNNTAFASVNDMYSPFSSESHENMSVNENSNSDQVQSLYNDTDNLGIDFSYFDKND